MSSSNFRRARVKASCILNDSDHGYLLRTVLAGAGKLKLS